VPAAGFRQLSLGGPMVVKMLPVAGKRGRGGGRPAFWAPCGGGGGGRQSDRRR